MDRRAGASARLTIPSAGRRPWVFERAERLSPSVGELAAYVGRYRSDELGVIWEIVLEEGKLIARQPPLDDVTLEPQYLDAFTWDSGHAVFERDDAGAVSAMRFGTDRARMLWMARIDD